jgi:hypothetical protein
MQTKLAANYRHFSVLTPELVQPRVISYPAIDEDRAALTMAFMGLAFMAITTASTLVAFSIF